MATNAAAMPPAVWKNLRRDMLCFLDSVAPIAFTRASNSFCCADWGEGMNSSLELTWTGIGEGNSDSAASSLASSSGVIMGVASSVKDHRMPAPRLGKLALQNEEAS